MRIQTFNDKTNILGMSVHKVDLEQAGQHAEEFLQSKDQHFAVTVNPEIVMLAQKDADYRITISRRASLLVPDGFGLILASLILCKPLFHRVTGVDLTLKVCGVCERLEKSVYLLGSTNDVLEKTEHALKRLFPKLTISGKDASIKSANLNDTLVIERINTAAPSAVFVALGAPHQEKWIYQNLKKIPSVRFAMGVGGTFDYISGSVRRAPLVLRMLGLEWLFRLFLQPKRLKRIYTAVVLFPIAVLKWRFGMWFSYRKNALILIFKEKNDEIKFFLGKRAEGSSIDVVCQLPQGGIENGENAHSAAVREMQEELGTNKFEILHSVPQIYKYRWSNSKDKDVARWSRLVYGKCGQIQNLFIMKFTGKDSDFQLDEDELTGFSWVTADDLLAKIEPIRRIAAQRALSKFNTFICREQKFLFPKIDNSKKHGHNE